MDLFLQTTSDYALVMEDDAVPSPGLDWVSILRSLEMEMAKHDLNYIQLGFISQLYKQTPIRKALKGLASRRNQASASKTLTLKLAGLTYEVILGESRAGTHGYIIDRAFAERVSELNEPVWVSTDGFFDRLASAQISNGFFRMGRMKFSLVEQESRQESLIPIDSDI
jgi:GR25 family glycosyltransferase involved in LPS biosynthesis